MSLTLRSASRTDVGRHREGNEDSCFAGGHLFIVADGLGGHKGGEVASALAVETVRSLADLEAARAAADLASVVRAANQAVLDRARSDADLSGMGTTMTAVVIAGSTARLVHVGDSRCYLIRDGVIQQLTQDHTMVARMVRDGRLTPQEAEQHPQRSMLTRAVGSEPQIDLDEADIALAPGDRLLLCSDGLTNMLTDGEIAALARDGDDLDAICDALVDAANAHGGVDNITVVLVDISGTPDDDETPVATALQDDAVDDAVDDAATRGRAVPRRAIVWLALVLALTVGGAVGLRAWADTSWYVGHTGGDVAVFQGLPMDIPLLRLHRVVQQTEIALDDLPEYLQREIREGITADSLDDARRVIQLQILPKAIPS